MHPMAWVGIGLAIAILLLAIVDLIWFSKKMSVRCGKCGHVFKPKVLKALFGMHLIDKIGLICPLCGEYSVMKIIKDKDLKRDAEANAADNGTASEKPQ